MLKMMKSVFRINRNQPESTRINPYQPVSTRINLNQPESIRINQNQLRILRRILLVLVISMIQAASPNQSDKTYIH